ncbi:MAG: BlaI/MecI/CopY family transcriptional regulator [Pyrinomonadaceae bacterium]
MKSKPTLANSELAIIELLWDSGTMTARDIRERLYSDKSGAQHGTVQKLLQRLENKGYITRDSSQFTHTFTAKISREEYAGSQLESLASKLTSGSIAPLITHLMETSRISEDDIAEIRALIDEYAEKEKKK